MSYLFKKKKNNKNNLPTQPKIFNEQSVLRVASIYEDKEMYMYKYIDTWMYNVITVKMQ